MSAPWEVWVEITTDNEQTFVGDAFNEHTIDRDVRYLRADLTCGECAKCRKSNCDHKVGVSSSAVQTWPYEDSPACMAFAPKEQP